MDEEEPEEVLGSTAGAITSLAGSSPARSSPAPPTDRSKTGTKMSPPWRDGTQTQTQTQTRTRQHTCRVRLPKVQLSKVQLPKLQLSKVQLPKLQLSKLQLPKVQLSKVRLSKVQLYNVQLRASSSN
ncbi:hypothetical protein CRUP_030847 [Coryphaenoides rupestris]|nr:hypothetical protein CRUP_030847 [Coryphaenoides rupestris]